MQAEIHCLVIALDLPLYIRCEVSQKFEDCATSLCMLLQCLSYPSCLVDIEMQFGWEQSRFHVSPILLLCFYGIS